MTTPSRSVPRFPIYIPSKGRADVALTMHTLDLLSVPYRVIVEEQQYRAYAAAYPQDRLLVLPREFQDEYDPCDGLGRTRSLGPGPARNFAWAHAIDEGHPWHWVMDDNINCFGRLHQNMRRRVGDGMIFHAMEDFCLRYLNVGMAGPEYSMFLPSREARKAPYQLNKRIFSCNLIRNDIEPRWRGRYNEDLDLSIMILRAGYVTVRFDAFWQEKKATQRLPGGNTEEFYAREGGRTLAKSQLAVAMHPDIVTLTRKWGRWHHTADFSEFKNMQLIRDPAWTPPVSNPYRTRLTPNDHFRKPLNDKSTQAAAAGDLEHEVRLPPPWAGRRRPTD